MFQRQFQVCLLVWKGPKFHNIGTNDVNCRAECMRPSINIKDKVWQTVLLVTSSKPACRCLLFPLLHAKRWKRETFLHAKNEIGDVCTLVTLWPWWVKFRSSTKHNCITTTYPSFRHFPVKK